MAQSLQGGGADFGRRRRRDPSPEYIVRFRLVHFDRAPGARERDRRREPGRSGACNANRR